MEDRRTDPNGAYRRTGDRGSAQRGGSVQRAGGIQRTGSAQRAGTGAGQTVRRRKKRSSGAKIAMAFLYVLVVIGGSAILATVGWTWACDLLALNKDPASAVITIPDTIFTQEERTDEEGNTETVSKADLDYVTDLLKEEGLIEYKFLFKLFGKFSHADTKIVPGTYELGTEMDYRALIVNMSSKSANRQEVDVTIPEGYNIDQIFALLEENSVSTVDKLRETAASYPYRWDFLQKIPLGDYHRLEGYLFPDTYTFYTGQDPVYVLNKMLNGFHAKMKSYYSRFETKTAEDGTEIPPEYSLHDIVNIASLIEKETDTEDRRNIASVIYNRLEHTENETAGLLQIDATLVYINGGKVPTEADKSIDSPYNTYLYTGLPAGPIANPGIESLLAAMDPASTKYYYYVLNPETGRHEFSKTYKEHQKLVEKYANYVPEE